MNNSWIIKTVFLLLGVYVILLCLANAANFQQFHHQYFIQKNNFLFGTYGNGGQVSFYQVPKSAQNNYLEYDVLIKLSSEQQRERAIKKARKEGKSKITYEPVQYDINSWSVYGMLYIFLLAFAIAMPLNWKNKLIALIGSFILLELFFMLKIWILLTLKFSIWYKKFEVGWRNDFLIDILNDFLIIITYPFFGMLFIVIINFLINGRKLSQQFILT